jgi:hypothetical protein
MASTHGGVDLASSNGRKALGMDSPQLCHIGRLHGSDKLERCTCDYKSRAIFLVGLELSLGLIPLASMMPTNALWYVTINHAKNNYV